MADLAAPYRNNSLSSDDVRQLSAYLLELKPVAADAVMDTSSGGATEGTAEERGEAVFTGSSGCSGCHSTGSDDLVGPGLAGLSSRSSDAEIHQSIVDPSAIIVKDPPDSVMPQIFGSTLSSDELNDLIAYLKSL
jgi:cytochrome c oxidase subunit 2